MVLKVVRSELAGAVDSAINNGVSIPEDLSETFEEWLTSHSRPGQNNPNKVILPDYDFPPYDENTFDPSTRDVEIRNADGSLKNSAGDRLIERFMAGSDQGALDARAAAGLSVDAEFRLLTDDMEFVRKIRNSTGSFDADQLALKGHSVMPYAGTTEFWAVQLNEGNISGDEYRGIRNNFESSGRKLSTGFGSGTGEELFNNRASWLNDVEVDRVQSGVFRNIISSFTDLLQKLRGDENGSVDTTHLLKGGVLSGAIGLASKFGVIGDVLAFTMTMNAAEELRENGEVEAANELWVRYIAETSGGVAIGLVAALGAAKAASGSAKIYASIVAGLLGSVAGSLAGAELGSWLYNNAKDQFDPFFEKLYSAIDIVTGEGLSPIEAAYVEITEAFGFAGEPVFGTEENDVLFGARFGEVFGFEGDDILIGLQPESIDVGEAINPDEQDSAIAESNLRLKLDGGAGNDILYVVGGKHAITAGGEGNDIIFNRSAGGQIFGDTTDGILLSEGEAPRSFAEHDALDTSANGDYIWWWPTTTMWDPQRNDVLSFFGIPLVGGNTQLPALGFLGGAVSSFSSLTSLVNARNNVFFDYFMPFITYKYDAENSTLLVGNIFARTFGLFGGDDGVENTIPGVMQFLNFDDANAVLWGGAFYKPSDEPSFGGLFSYSIELNTDLIGDLGMIFKITHPALGIMAALPGYPGGINRLLPLIDELLTWAGAASLQSKAAGWASGADPLIIDLDGDGIETVSINEGVQFDIDGDFFREEVSWLASDDGFLAIDLNGNGAIDDISELFGEGETPGFTELAAYDSNGDGIVSGADLAFGDLLIWRDLDQDGISTEDELYRLDEVGILSIALGGNDLNVTTPQGVTITRSGEVTFEDGFTSHAYDALFEFNDTQTAYRGESGVPAWLTDTIIDSRGFGEVTDFGIAMSNDFDIMRSTLDASEAMTTPDLAVLREQAGEALGLWGYGQALTRELSPVLTETVGDTTTLVDRAIWVEDTNGGYWTLESGNPIQDDQGVEIARPTLSDVMAQSEEAGQSWTLEQMWSPATRGEELEHREAAPYLGSVVEGRFVVDDYGVQQSDGSWQLASGTAITNADGAVIASPTVADVLAMDVEDRQEWRVEEFGFNPLANITTEEVGVYFVDGTAVDYTVEVTDQDGTFHVWARNLDRALELQDKFGDPRDFNLRNYEIDFDTLDEVGSTDDSTYRVEVITPAQFNFSSSLIGIEFSPAMLAATIDEATGVIDYSINGEEAAWQADLTRPSAINIMTDLLDVMMDQWVVVSRAFAVRMALQGGLSQYAVDIEYDIDTDTYRSTGDRELAPMFEAIFADAPAGYEAAQDYLADWNEILWQIYPDYQMDGTQNLFGGTVSFDQKFLVQMVLPAYEAYPLDVDLPTILNALSANEELLVRHDASATDVDGDGGVNFIYLSGSDQTYRGGEGADVYFVGANWGNDVIEDVDSGGADELRFTSVKSTEVIATRDGQDLILMKDGAADVLRVENHFLGELNPSFGNSRTDTRMTSIVFADGVIWGRVEIASAVSRPDDSDQVIVGSGDLDVLDGGAGNDVLRGGAGGDMYKFGRGYGQDVIAEDNSSSMNPLSAGIDFLQFLGDDLDADDLFLQRFGEGDDLHITLLDDEGNLTDDTLTLEDQFDGLRLNLTGFLATNVDSSLELDYIAPNLVERFLFENGSSLDFDQMAQAVLDNAKTDGSDAIYGFLHANSLDGGAGDDYLVGREGGDTYIYGRDYGLDQIEDGDYSVKLFGAPDDYLAFIDDLRWTDFDFLRDGATDNLTLQVSGTTDGVVFQDFLLAEPFQGFINLIEWFNFADGTEWHYTQLLQHYVDIAKTDGDDTIYGFLTADSIDGGRGDDDLQGQGGSDTYILRAGDGSDRILDTGGASDRVQLQNIALDDVDFTRTGLDLIVTNRVTGEVTTFVNQYVRDGAQGFAIEVFEFSDQVVNFNDINPEDIDRAGTAGDDYLEGSDFAETIDGLGGNDTLVGGSDGDIYKFDVGYGNDLIVDQQVAAVWAGRNGREVETGDRIQFGNSITRDMIVFSKDGNDLYIEITGFPDTLRIRGQFSDVTEGVEFFDFADGSVLFISDVEELLQITGGNRGDNRIEGVLDQENVLDGRQGDDVLVGGNLADTYAFGIDYDFDRIEEQADTPGVIDRVIMGQGVRVEDLVLRRSGDDLLLDIGNGADVLTIVGGLASNIVEEFLFADGQTLTLEDIRDQMLRGTDGNDQLVGFNDRADVLNGGEGTDALIGGTGDDTYEFGYTGGQDEIIDTGGFDTLAFGAGIAAGHLAFADADGDLLITLRETDESIVVIGGLSEGEAIDRFTFEDGTELGMDDIRGQLFNETPTAGINVIDGTLLDPIWTISPGIGADKVIMGADTHIVFENGDGMDTFIMPSNGVGDALIELTEYGSADVSVRSVGTDGHDVALDFPDTGDQIILVNALVQSVIPTIRFADGIEWDKAALQRALVFSMASENDDVITGTSIGETIEGSEGDDDIRGNGGDDLFVYHRGDGSDIIADSSGNDVLRIFGYTPADVAVTRPNQDRDDVILSFTETGDSITLRYSGIQGVDSVEFSDGTSWSRDDLYDLSLGTGTQFDDIITGSDAGNALAGFAGNDTLEGAGGDDVYLVGFSEGQDRIVETAGVDRLVLGEALSTDIVLSQIGNDALIRLPGESSVRLVGQFGADTDKKVDFIEFADGTEWTASQLQSEMDTALRSRGLVLGTEAFDTYYHTKGDGSYLILDYDTDSFPVTANDDKFVFTDSYEHEVSVHHAGDDAVLRLDNGEEIRILGMFAGTDDYEIETVEFADGATWNVSTMLQLRASSQVENGGVVIGTSNYDIYRYAQGDGSYAIIDYDTDSFPATANDDYFIFTDLLPEDVTVGHAGDDAILRLSNGDEVRIVNLFASTDDYEIETFEFADGTTWNVTTLLQERAANQKSDGALIEGTSSFETYTHTKGDGSYTISDYDTDSFPATANDDKLILTDSLPDEVTVLRADNDAILLLDNGETIRIDQAFSSGDDWHIETIEFSDGSTWDITTLRNLQAASSKASGIVRGTLGFETYTHARGDGSYTIYDYDTESNHDDKLVFADINSNEVTAYQSGNDLILSLPEDEEIRVFFHFGGDDDHYMETIEFADGVTWDVVDIAANLDLTDLGRYFEGSSSEDVYTHTKGDGSKTIHDYDYSQGNDRLEFTDTYPDQVTLSRIGNDLVVTLDNGEQINFNYYLGANRRDVVEVFQFADGTTWNESAIRDRLVSDMSKAGYAQGTENDETYVHTSGDGSYSISDYDYYLGSDRLLFEDLTQDDVTVGRLNNDAVLVLSTGESIRLLQQFNESQRNSIEVIEFSDGTTWDTAEIRQQLVSDAKPSGHVEGTELDETYFHASGDGSYTISDYDYWLGSDKLILIDLLADQIIVERVNNDAVLRLPNGETIRIQGQLNENGRNSIETIEFADGSSWNKQDLRDRQVADAKSSGNVVGTENDETYNHFAGDGSYTITDYDYWQGNDRLVLHDQKPDELEVARFGDDAMLYLSNGETLRIVGQLNTSGRNSVEEIEFSDGTTWSRGDLQTLIETGSLPAEVLPTDTIVGTADTDFLVGDETDNILIAGLSDDKVSGGAGNDTYRYAAGDGADVVDDNGGGTDQLEIIGYSTDDLVVSRNGRDGTDLILSFGNTVDQITITNGMLAGNDDQIEDVVFIDSGETLEISDLRLQTLTGSATDGNDQISGNSSANVIAGGLGNDRLEGGSGDDIYLYAQGDGDDRVVDTSGTGDRLVLSDYGISELLWVARTGETGTDMVLKFGTDRDRITLEGVLASGTSGADIIEFADGTTWDRSVMREVTLLSAQTVSDDLVVGFDGADSLYGGLGDDMLEGGEGADLYTMSRGNGFDEILDGGTNADDIDRVEFANFVSTEVSITRLFKGSDAVVLEFATADDVVTIFNALTDDGTAIEEIAFSDGVVWTTADLIARIDNTAPEAVSDGYFTATQDSPLMIGAEELLRNDFDPDGQDISIIAVDGGDDGVAEIDAQGNVVFTGNQGFYGVTTLSYTISDGFSGLSTATVDLRVRPEAEAKDDDGFTVNEDGTLTIRAERLLSNDLDGDRMIVGEVFDAHNGVVSLASNGDITFSPTADFNGIARFSYAANTSEGGRAEAIVTIDVTAENDDPDAHDDSGFTTLEDQVFEIFASELIENDADIDGDALTIVSVTGNADITVELTDDGLILVTPAPLFWGDASFTYTVEDAEGVTDTATVNIYVEPVNNTPEPAADTATTDEDQPILIDVDDLLANDLDPDGDTLTVTDAYAASNGNVQLLENGTVLYTPQSNFFGEGGFTYIVDDGQGGTATARVTIDVTSINDAPEARDDTYLNNAVLSGTEDASLVISISTLLANDGDIEDNGVEFIDVFSAVDGAVEVTPEGTILYTPDQDFWGETTFYYNVRDSEGAVDEAAVSIWFENVGDAPPVANTDTIEVFEDVPTIILFDTLLANDTDIDRDPLEIFGWASRGSYFDLNGTVEILENGTGFLFTPNLNSTESDGFLYAVTDNADGTDLGLIEIQMIAVPDDPTAVNDEGGTTAYDVPLVIRVSDLLANDFDVDEESVSFESLDSTSAGIGSVYGDDEFVVVHFEAGFTGSFDLQYSIIDPTGLTDEGFITAAVADLYTQVQIGTDQRDLLIGNALSETLSGGMGDDDIFGEAGSDVVFGGEGNDLIYAGDGADFINAGDGEDEIFGGGGFDYVSFEGSNTGVRADLTSRVGQGGFAQGDLYSGVEGLIGSDYIDRLYGDAEMNILQGGLGDDLLFGGDGDDHIQGQSGDDTLAGGAGGDSLAGGEGADTVDYFDSGEAVSVDLDVGTGSGGDAEGDTLTSIENVIGSEFADVLIGDAADNRLEGGRDADTLIGGEGDDTLIGGRGADILQGGDGIDKADYSLSVEGVTINMVVAAAGGGDAEGDTFSDIEIVQGSYHDDVIIGDASDNIIRGGLGADSLDGGAGFDTLDYSQEAEGIAIDIGTGTGSAGAATGDQITDFEHITGTNWDDTITGSDADETFDGGSGTDVLAGAAGNDTYLFGFGSGADTVFETGAGTDLDSVVLGEGVENRDVSLRQEGNDLLIELEREVGIITDSFRVTDHFLGAETGIEQITFEDGTTWDRAQIDALIRLGSFQAEDDVYLFGVEDEVVAFDVARLLENDAVEGADALEIVEVIPVSGGTPTLHSDGRLTFLGDQNHNGDAFFDYVVRDPFGRESTARVEVNLAPVNDAPEGADDGVFYGTEDTKLLITYDSLLGNDFDIDGDVLSVDKLSALVDVDGNPLSSGLVYDLTNGRAKFTGEGIEFEPVPDHFGFAGFTYEVVDPDGLKDTAKVELYFAAVNDAPRSGADDFTVRLSSVIRIDISDLLSNDFDPEHDAFTYGGVHNVQGGILEVKTEQVLMNPGAPAGSIAIYEDREYLEFTPAALGDATFQYDLIDEFGAASTHTVEIEVIPDNDPPRANNDLGFETLEDEPIYIDVATLLENDTDPNGDVLLITSVERFPQNGRVKLLDDGRIVFTPRSDFNGQAGFEYTITDGEFEDSAFVAITIIPSNDAPVVNDDVTSWYEDAPLTIVPGEIFGNDYDADGDVIFIDHIQSLGALDRNYLIETRNIEVQNIDDLPDWITYDPAAKLISGEMPYGFDETVTINVTSERSRWDGLVDDIVEASKTLNLLPVSDPGHAARDAELSAAAMEYAATILRLNDDVEDSTISLDLTAADAGALERGIDLDEFFETQALSRIEHETTLLMADVLKPEVTFVITQVDGSALPDWLSFDEDTLSFTGIWPDGAIAPVDLSIDMSFDADGLTYSYVATTQITDSDANALVGPAGLTVLTDIPVLDLLTTDVTISATSANGHPLPAWIDFDADTMSFVATNIAPDADEGLLRLRVKFTPDFPDDVALPDDFHLAVDGSYELEFVVDPTVGIDPAINTMLQSQAFFAAQGLFALPQLDPTTLTASLGSLTDLPDWLTFDTETLSYSGLPPLDYVGGLPVRIDVPAQSGQPEFSILHDLPVDIGFQSAGGSFGGTYDGEYIYPTAPEDFYGAFALEYWATDEKGAVSDESAILVINLAPTPELPDAIADRFDGVEDEPLVIALANILANDFDEDRDPVRVIEVADPEFGSLTVNLTSQELNAPITIDLVAGQSISVTLSDGLNLPDGYIVDPSTGTITTPVLALDHLDELEVLWTVVDDADGSVIETFEDTVRIDGNVGATLTYLGTPGAWGEYSFDYTLTDDAQGTVTGTVVLDLAPVNDPPEAVEDLVLGIEDQTSIITIESLLENDFDVDGDPITFVGAFGASDGTIEMVNGDIHFMPFTNFFGETNFFYEITDGPDGSGIGEVVINVAENNTAPVAGTDVFAGTEDTSILIDPNQLLLNDTDNNLEDTVTFVGIFDAVGALGNAFERPDGLWQLTPNVNVNGVVTFTYEISDGRLVSEGEIEIDFAAVNDAPTVRDDGIIEMGEDGVLSIDASVLLANDTDVEGDAMLVSAAFDGVNGDVSIDGQTITFTPRADHFGNAGFTYTVQDVHGADADGFVSISVLPLNDLPVAADDLGFAMDEDTTLLIDPAMLLANDSDPDGDLLVFLGFDEDERLMANGDGTYSFTPNLNENGVFTLDYTVGDSGGLTDRALVVIDVANTADAPVATNDTLILDEDQVLTLPVSDLLGNDVDPDGDALSIVGVVPQTGISIVIDPFQGVIITPDADFNGSTGFDYTVEDTTGLLSTATVSVTLRPVNDAPEIANLADIQSLEDTLLQAELPAEAFFDVDGDLLFLSARLADGSALPDWLSFVGSTRQFQGTPPADFNGTLDVLIQASDGETNTTAAVQIVIEAVNDAPAAQDDVWNAGTDTVITIPVDQLLLNDSDVDGDELTITEVFGARGFTAGLDGLGNIVVTRDSDLSGEIFVAYTLSDGTLSDEGVITIDLLAANQAPIVANLGTLQTAEDEPIDLSLPEGTVSDPDGDSLTVTLTRVGGIDLPDWLSFDAATQRISGTPPQNFNGVLGLALTAFDGQETTTSEFLLEITAVNDTPILLAPLSGRTAQEDTPFDITLQQSLFEDPDGDTLSFALTLEDGSALPDWIDFDPTLFAITGQAPSDFSGDVVLRMTASDGQESISDDFNLTVIAVNDAPILIDPLPDVTTDQAGLTLATGVDFVIDVPVANFIDPDGDELGFAVSLADGSVLPDWISFDGESLIGRAPRSEAGTTELLLRATDGTYIASDTFAIFFEERNTPPLVADINVSVTVPNAVSFNISDLLATASDFDGDDLTITAIGDAENGTVNVDDEVAVYLAEFGFEGTDSFTYEVSDGTDTTVGTVSVTIDNPFVGDDAGNNQDVLIGDSGTDIFFGGRGSDLISGGAGADYLFGGRGSDVIYAGDGVDLAFGGGGADSIDGGAGTDFLFGGTGADSIRGGQGDDVLFGGRGNDTFYYETGDGNDVIYGFAQRRSFIQGDQIRLGVDGVESYADLLNSASNVGGGVLFDFGNGDQIFLAGTRLAALDEDQFSFY